MNSRSRIYQLTAISFLAAALVIGCATTTRPAAAPAPPSFERALVMRGAQLASLGNCEGCHTASGGAPYAGGRALKTSFGTLYGSNITPAADSGIGGTTEAALKVLIGAKGLNGLMARAVAAANKRAGELAS